MVFVFVDGIPIKEDLIPRALVCGGDGIPQVGGRIGIGLPLPVCQGDGAPLMEEVVVRKSIDEAIVIGILDGC